MNLLCEAMTAIPGPRNAVTVAGLLVDIALSWSLHPTTGA